MKFSLKVLRSGHQQGMGAAC